MAGADPADGPKFTGLAKHFNTFTTTGRANIAGATLGSALLLVLFFKLKPSKK